jgi:hypothetical protein
VAGAKEVICDPLSDSPINREEHRESLVFEGLLWEDSDSLVLIIGALIVATERRPQNYQRKTGSYHGMPGVGLVNR